MLKLFTLCIKNKKNILYGEKNKQKQQTYYMVRNFWDTLYIQSEPMNANAVADYVYKQYSNVCKLNFFQRNKEL